MMDRLRGKSVHRSPSFDQHSAGDDACRSGSESLDGRPPARLDDRALNSRLQTTGHDPNVRPKNRDLPHGHDGSSDAGGFHKEIRSSPPRHLHPAVADLRHEKAREAMTQPPVGPHPSELPTREKHSWNPFGRRQQHDRDADDRRLGNDEDYTDSEGSFTESELDDEYHRQQPQGRRPSIADRILGRSGARGDEDRPRVEDFRQEDTAKKPGWKIWR
jgi:hypothetical protein